MPLQSLHPEMIPLRSENQSSINYPKTYTCGFCGKNCYTPSKLDQHLLTHTGEKPFMCSVCNSSFRQKAHLTQHLTVHTGEKPFKCSACSKTFTRKSTCKGHFLTHHMAN